MVKEILEESYNIYCYGSVVYGTHNVNSDKDYIVIVPDYIGDMQLKENNSDYNIFTETTWINKCNNNDVECLECKFLKNEFIIKETKKYDFDLDFQKIKHNIGSISSNSYVKCNKKLTVKNDYNPYIAKKSLWHSLRLIMFGIQLCEKGYINDYSCANIYYNSIMNEQDNWEILKEKYKPIYNELKTKWRTSIPKQINDDYER